MQKRFIKYLVIIIVILVVIFLSQQAYFREFGKTFISNATNQANAYLAKGSNWLMSAIYPKISGEVQKRGDIINKEINKEKEKVSENIGTKIKNYFSGISDAIFHPSNNSSPSSAPMQNESPAPAASRNCNCPAIAPPE